MKYKVTSYDKNNKIIKSIIHKEKYNDYVRYWKDDFYFRYIWKLDEKTDKRNDIEILLKEPIQNIIRIKAQNIEN